VKIIELGERLMSQRLGKLAEMSARFEGTETRGRKGEAREEQARDTRGSLSISWTVGQNVVKQLSEQNSRYQHKKVRKPGEISGTRKEEGEQQGHGSWAI